MSINELASAIANSPGAPLRLPYRTGASQFGDLWTPRNGAALHPVVVFLHGGWWKAARSLDYAAPLCEALCAAGLAVWSLEYRRVGETGGGWPGTFADVAAGLDHLHGIASQHQLDLSRVITAGHSAGGHLAFWLAGRHHVPAGLPGAMRNPPVRLRGTLSLAGAVDLKVLCELSQGVYTHDQSEVAGLMGGLPEQLPERFLGGDPGYLLPFGIPQILVQGSDDGQIPPELPARWATKSRAQGETVTVTIVPGASHGDVADPRSSAWPAVRGSALALLGLQSH